ncbi:hypothetical protein [Asanoa siamensis]|uniref:Uncharacterized protein n=1 Tax=Asanoa siamensis TaxID=926357 RepID=A0ABQ4CHK0_9ACTN|nr:hypothetical protein [Asanoa siamensis]GIF70773.1 hypothetical protein Asi02nite_02910 [Asanoa siamensis]
MPAVPWWRAAPARGAYVVLGAASGLAIALWSTHRGSDLWVVWAGMAIGLTTASGAVFGYGLARWPEILAAGAVRRSAVLRYVALLGCASLLLFAVSLAVSASAPGTEVVARRPIGLLLVTLAVLAAVPVAAGLAAIRERAFAIARDEQVSPTATHEPPDTTSPHGQVHATATPTTSPRPQPTNRLTPPQAASRSARPPPTNRPTPPRPTNGPKPPWSRRRSPPLRTAKEPGPPWRMNGLT